MKNGKILIVDDEAFNLDILETDLQEVGFQIVRADDGDMVFSQLAKHPDVDIIVLDRMMPRMGGIEVLKALKADERYSAIPVIMQTAAAQSDQVLEGIRAGAYYYLAKPYDEEMLLSIVRAARQDATRLRQMREEVHQYRHVMGLIEHAQFRFRTLEEAKNVAYYVANCCPDPENIVFGLSELMINAVEHGNLGLGYNEKTKVLLKGNWQEEIEKRLGLPDNHGKFALLVFETTPGMITITIRDKGKGFDWRRYLEFEPKRLTDPHGRGIAMAKGMGFAKLEYKGCGNEVVCIIPVA